MSEREIDNLGRPTLNERESQQLAFHRLLLAAKDPDWDGSLGAAAEIALALDDPHLLLLVGYREDILINRGLVVRGIDPQKTEKDIRREWFGT